jgi:hypothetical protein
MLCWPRYFDHKKVRSCVLCWSQTVQHCMILHSLLVTICAYNIANSCILRWARYCLWNIVCSCTLFCTLLFRQHCTFHYALCLCVCDLLSHVSIRDSNIVNPISQIVIKLPSGSPSAWYLTTRHQYYQRNSRNNSVKQCTIINLVTFFVLQDYSWEGETRSAGQEIPRIFSDDAYLCQLQLSDLNYIKKCPLPPRVVKGLRMIECACVMWS